MADPTAERPKARAAADEAGFFRARRMALIVAPLLALAILVGPRPDGLSAEGQRVGALATWMAIWWITEAIPIPITSLLPIVVLPVLGAASIQQATAPYAHPLVFLFLGGFVLALGMQRWGLHRRIALHIIRGVGTRPAALVAGFMLSAALLSMWVSNTATAMMMLPIALSVIELSDTGLKGRTESSPFAVALLLGVAHACSIGGLGTLIGTPPNAFLAAFLSETYGMEIGFAQWMTLGLPAVALGLPLSFLVLTRFAFPLPERALTGGRVLLDRELAALGRMGRGEKSVAIVFALTALAWIGRPVLGRWIPGLSDTGIAVAAAVSLFVVPARWRRGEFLLDWSWSARLPWAVLLLFGGGLSLASAVRRSGLADWLATTLQGLSSWPVLAIVVAAILMVMFLTELTSNTATAAAFLPILASVAEAIGKDPLLMVIPAALAASCAFMLPVATPPNAIVYGSDQVTIPQMARAGFFVNLGFVFLITALTYGLAPLVFGVRIR